MIEALLKKFAARQKRELDTERKNALTTIELTTREEKLRFDKRVHDERVAVIDQANEKKLELATTIAKLEAEAIFKAQLVDALKNTTEKELEVTKKAYENIIATKDATIKELHEDMKVLIEKLPEVKLSDLNVNVASPSVHGVSVAK